MPPDDDSQADVDDDFGDDFDVDDDSDNDGDFAAAGWWIACTLDVSIDIEATAEVLVSDLRLSLAEMIGCGQLTVDLTRGVQEGVVDAVLAGRGDATPDGWTYAGNGTYTTSAASAAMETRFYAAGDFEFARAGDAIEHDVFLLDSYLIGASLRIPENFWEGAELHYDEAGPLVELLGYGAAPPNPISVDLDDLARIGNRLADLEFESDIRVEDARDASTIIYEIHTDRLPSNALLGGGAMRYELDSLVARTDDLEVDVTDWSSRFLVSGRLEGEMSFDIDIDATLQCEAFIDFQQLPRPSGD